MTFDLTRWKELLTHMPTHWRNHLQEWSQADTALAAYTAAATFSIWPVVQTVILAAQQGQNFPLETITSAAVVMAGLGSNLMANQLQQWYEQARQGHSPTEIEVKQWLENQLLSAEFQQGVGQILEKVDGLPQVIAHLVAEQQRPFLTQLEQNIAQLGQTQQFQPLLVQLYHTEIHQSNEHNQGGVNINSAGDTHLRDITVIGTQIVYQTSPPPPLSPLQRAYLEWVQKASNQVTLDTIDYQTINQPQASLQLGAVYTALLTTGWQKGLWSWDLLGRGHRRSSAVEQLNQHACLVLLGDPGSGKSTFLNFVALCHSGELAGDESYNLPWLTRPLLEEIEDAQREKREPLPQPWEHGPLLPVRIVLRDLAARGLPAAGEPVHPQHLWEFIGRELYQATLGPYLEELQQTLRDKGGIFLFDGLDEVPESKERRVQVKDLILATHQAFPKCRILVTCRTYAYQDNNWHLPNFEAVMLTPFTTAQINQFIEGWYNHVAQVRQQNLDGRAKLLQTIISLKPRLQELAERPLLLTLMVSLHAWRGGNLPDKRQELYEDAVRLLLDRWEQQRIIRKPNGEFELIHPSLEQWLKIDDREKIRRLLNRLAFEAHATGELEGAAGIPEEKLVLELMKLSNNPDISTQHLVKYLCDRAGLLLPREEGLYTLPHRTFQEYLAACHLVTQGFPSLLAKYGREDATRWREVVMLAGAKVGQDGQQFAVWSLAKMLCPHPLPAATPHEHDQWGAYLAGQLLTEQIDLHQLEPAYQDDLHRVRTWLVYLLRHSSLPSLERAKAGRYLALLGDPRPTAQDVNQMELCFVPPGPFIMGSNDEKELEIPIGKPAHEVNLPYPYWVSRWPVTESQYQQFVTAGGYSNPAYWTEAAAAGFWQDGQVKGYAYRQGKWRQESHSTTSRVDYGEEFTAANQPVVGVSWYEALAFTRWLTAQWQNIGWLPTTWQVTLPSEAEWEKAARGGLEILEEAHRPFIQPISHLKEWQPVLPTCPNPDPDRPYPWPGREITPEHANYDEAKIGSPSAVGCFPLGVSPAGCEELGGNVAEWTRSVWGRWDKQAQQFAEKYAYPYEPGGRREDITADDWHPRTLRLSLYAGSSEYSLCAVRGWHNPVDRNRNVGFRFVVVPLSS